MDTNQLLPAQQPIAQCANLIIKTRYGFKDGKILTPIDKKVRLRPTLLWDTTTEYICCEAADRPFPKTVKETFLDIAATGMPIRMIVAYPKDHTLQSKDYQEDVSQAKRLGIGFLSVEDSSTGLLENEGIPISLFLPQPDISNHRRCLIKGINDSYALYINGNPPHGVQELGQIVEQYINSLATQAKKKGKLQNSKYTIGKYYRFAKLVEDLIDDKTINLATLGRCRGFVDDRNITSHKPKSKRHAIDLSRKIKNCFSTGLLLLEELPKAFEGKGYKFKIL